MSSSPPGSSSDVNLPALNIGGGGNGGGGGPEEMPPTPRRRDVQSMPSFEIMEQLRRRNCVPTGFYEDDKKMLQALFDEDYEQQKATRQAYMAKVNANRKENYSRDFAERKQRRDNMEISTALKHNPQVPVWLEQVKKGQCHPFASWNGVKKPLVRHIASNLPVQSQLVGLEFSRCKINDEVCDLIAAMLMTNRSLRQLNLGENLIGAAGLQVLAKALRVNDVLKFIGLQGNLLRRNDATEPTDEGVEVFADMLKVNNTLVRVNILNTGLVQSSFALLGDALRQNASVLIVDMDTTPVSLSDAKVIKEALLRNQKAERHEEEKRQQQRLIDKRAQQGQLMEEQKQKEAQEELNWVERERKQRVQDRKKLLEEKRAQERLEEERRKEIAAAKLQLALASAGAKKKKGKKKKGKKKK